MRTIRVALDTHYCRLSLKHIRCWNADPRNPSQIVIWLAGVKCPFYATESVEDFAERYEQAMDQFEVEEHNRMVQGQLKEAGF